MTAYIGRFAPSPTGPLHLGSLYSAVASFLDAKKHNGQWLLRIEDLDPPREQAGATQSIIKSLIAHDLHWDGDIMYQSKRDTAYAESISLLQEANTCYYCQCSRQQLKPFGESYPGFCREKTLTSNDNCAIRLIANPPCQSFHDQLLGIQTAPHIQEGCFYDFIIKRKDNLYAYQLAVVVDDITQGITDIVRGSDILDSTFKQTYLYNYLKQTQPSYLHLPVINNSEGQKLSKQNQAQAIDDQKSCENLLQVLTLLHQQLPPEHLRYENSVILNWACTHWDISRIPIQLSISPY